MAQSSKDTGPAENEADDRDDLSDEAVLKEVRDRMEKIIGADMRNRTSHKEDFDFVYVQGAQWSSDLRARRTTWQEPCLEFNQLKQFVNQVVNDMRQGRPGVRVHPASGAASEETAQILQGIIRGIEYDSKAETTYDEAFKSAVVGGRGYWRICSDYTNAESFDQSLMIKQIPDAMAVYSDLDYQEPDGSDKAWYIVTEKVHKDVFKSQWPDAKPLSFDDPGSKNWMEGESIVVADYYRRSCSKKTMVLMSDGNRGFKDTMPKTLPPGVTVLKEREVEQYKVEWYKIAGGQQVLAEYDWPGTIIPIVQVVGDECIIDGKRLYQGLIRHARDAQTMFNYGMTQQAVHLALTPRAPWVADNDAIEGYEEVYRDANQRNFSVLPFHAYDKQGRALPPPARTAPSLVDAGWFSFSQSMTGMIKSTIGMYENSLSQKGNETSGKAILAKERQGDNATFHLVDNLAKGIALTGRILLEVIPKFYDTQRIVHIVGKDDIRKMVSINQVSIDGSLNAIRMNDITSGEYSVTTDSGPSYATKRQEDADKLLQLVQAFPPVAQVAPDLIVQALDVNDAREIAQRLKMALPPAIQQAEAMKEKGQRPPDPQIMQQMMQMQSQLQQAQQIMQELQQKLQQAESGVQAKMQIAQMDNQAVLLKAQADTKLRVDQAQMDAQIAIEKAKIDSQTQLTKAQIDQQTSMERARMEQQTKLAIEDMKHANEAPAEDMTQVMQAIESLAHAAKAPRNMSFEMDDQGNIIGGTSSTEVEIPVMAGATGGAGAVLGAVQNLAHKLLAPKKHVLQFDSKGNIIGGTAVPVVH
jgi:hypothetical protein